MTAFWAIALNTIRMTTRRLAALVTFTAILLGFLFIVSFVEGDNTLIGLLRVLITWSFTFTSGLLMLLVLYFSSTVLDAEIVERQIYLLDVKPVRRSKVLAGKWTGLAILAGCLTLVMGCLTYGALRWIAHRPPSTARAETSAAAATGAPLPEARRAVDEELFASRRSWRPRLTHADRLAGELADELKRTGRVDEERAASPEFRSSLRALLERRVPPIPFEGSRAFTFTGLPTPAAGSPDLHIRYKLYGRRGREPELRLSHAWELGHVGAEPARHALTSTAGVSGEFRIGAAAVGADGTLELSLTNLTGPEEGAPAAELLVPAVDGIELLVPSGSFEMNFLRALLLLWIRLCTLAAIGIGANTFLRGRVTAFLLIGLILTGSLSSFVQSVVAPETAELELLRDDDSGHGQSEHGHAGHGHAGLGDADLHGPPGSRAKDTLLDAWNRTVAPILFGVLPNFRETDPVPDLLVGREIGWSRLLRQAFLDVGVRAGLVWLIGVYCFQRKEVGLPVTD